METPFTLNSKGKEDQRQSRQAESFHFSLRRCRRQTTKRKKKKQAVTFLHDKDSNLLQLCRSQAHALEYLSQEHAKWFYRRTNFNSVNLNRSHLHITAIQRTASQSSCATYPICSKELWVLNGFHNMEDLRKSPMEYKPKDQPVKTELGSRCVVFTYYQGDINSVVDEHFSRALRTTKDPQDLRTKNRGDEYLQKNMSNVQPDDIDWNKPYASSPSLRMAAPMLTTLGSPVDHYPVFQGHHTPPPDLYHYHHMGSNNQMSSVYNHPSVPEFQMVQGTGPDGKYSLLSLLQPERYQVPLQESIIKPDFIPSTATGPPGSETLNQRMTPQAGLHPQDRRKEFFHPQDRRKDLYFY